MLVVVGNYNVSASQLIQPSLVPKQLRILKRPYLMPKIGERLWFEITGTDYDYFLLLRHFPDYFRLI
jgi:hypothetical protein